MTVRTRDENASGFQILIDGLMIDDRLCSAVLRSLEQTHCARMLIYMSDWLFSAFFEYPPKWCTYSAGMAGGT